MTTAPPPPPLNSPGAYQNSSMSALKKSPCPRVCRARGVFARWRIPLFFAPSSCIRACLRGHILKSSSPFANSLGKAQVLVPLKNWIFPSPSRGNDFTKKKLANPAASGRPQILFQISGSAPEGEKNYPAPGPSLKVLQRDCSRVGTNHRHTL